MISVIRSKRRLATSERLSWLGIGIVSSLLLTIALSEPSEYFFSLAKIVCFTCGLTVAILGLLLNWGPLVPCAITGMVVFAYFTDPILVTNEAALFENLGVPTIGGAVGGMVGIFLDWTMNRPQSITVKPDKLIGGKPDRSAG